MTKSVYPFSAIVGQEEMKLALLLAAVDWRISVLLRGDKGAGKTTAARGLSSLLPQPSPFINLPIGATEDRLLGGLHLENTLKGEPTLKPGLLSQAHQGVLYVDEINLLPAHLGDTLLDAASSGVNVVEREGFSATHPAEFVLLGSMNPEEGTLRPQLLDRFALAVDVSATLDPKMRQAVVERRIAFEHRPSEFHAQWSQMERQLREQVRNARERHPTIRCAPKILSKIAEFVCKAGVSSLRADLAIVRASTAYAALTQSESVSEDHVSTVLPLVLAHRAKNHSRTQASSPSSSNQQYNVSTSSDCSPMEPSPGTESQVSRIFSPKPVETPPMSTTLTDSTVRGASTSTSLGAQGPIVGARRTEAPVELDFRATLNQALVETGNLIPKISHLHERIRDPKTGVRYLVVVDSSGSHAVQQRMRVVKGIANSLLAQSFKKGDEVALIVFRGTAAQVLLEPSPTLQDAATVLEYLPTGGRTPLAHALSLAHSYLTPETVMILLTDGRANVAMGSGDPWLEALDIASRFKTRAIVIDTENSGGRVGRSQKLAETLHAEYLHLDTLITDGPNSYG
jgi:magnesium chelatase subunit D